MTTIITRSGKGLPLTNAEMDANFTNLNNDKVEIVVQSLTSSASITPNANTTQLSITALAVDATINNPTGSRVEGRRLLIRIRDDGTIRNLTWGNAFISSLAVLPTATTATKLMYLAFYDNGTNLELISKVTEV